MLLLLMLINLNCSKDRFVLEDTFVIINTGQVRTSLSAHAY